MQIQVREHSARGFSVGFLRLIRHLVAVAAVVSLLTVFVPSLAFAAESKPFTGLKQCSGLITPTTQTCLLTQSSLKILLGATVNYTAIVFFADYLTSPVTLTAVDKRESTATGQCTFFYGGPTAGTGHCEWWSGTGKLAGFESAWVVGTANAGLMEYSLTGTYSFDRQT
jgi:hypothetical protein